MAQAKGIIAYGTESDRAKLDELAKASNMSRSQWLLQALRKAHSELQSVGLQR